MNSIITDNFTALLRIGSFNIEDENIVPMSKYKWRKLIELSDQLDVRYYIEKGMHMFFNEKNMPISITQESNLKGKDFDCNEARLYGILASRRFQRIMDEEPHTMDTSVESMKLLKLIVQNIDSIITSDLSLKGIIAVGEYLRTMGHRVDFVKLNNWIEKLHIIEMSSFIGCMLVELFDFEREEVEFISHTYRKPLSHYHRLLNNTFDNKHHFSKSSRLNLALFETISYNVSNVTSSILNVEE